MAQWHIDASLLSVIPLHVRRSQITTSTFGIPLFFHLLLPENNSILQICNHTSSAKDICETRNLQTKETNKRLEQDFIS